MARLSDCYLAWTRTGTAECRSKSFWITWLRSSIADKNGKLDANELKQLRILNPGGESSTDAWPLPAEMSTGEGGP